MMMMKSMICGAMMVGMSTVSGISFSSSLLNSVSAMVSGQCSNTDLFGKVGSLFPGLSSCYGDGSDLYLSPLSTVCSTRCLSTTVNAAQYVTSACQISLPSVTNPMQGSSSAVYSLWSNPSAAQVVCQPNQSGQGYCIGDLSNAAVQLWSLPGEKPFGPVNTAQVCTPCNRSIYQTFKTTPYAIPQVYFYSIVDPQTLLTNLGAACGWS